MALLVEVCNYVLHCSIEILRKFYEISREISIEEIEEKVVMDPNSEFAIVVEKGRFVWEVESKDPLQDKGGKKKKGHWWQRKKKDESDLPGSQGTTLNEVETESDLESEPELKSASESEEG